MHAYICEDGVQDGGVGHDPSTSGGGWSVLGVGRAARGSGGAPGDQPQGLTQSCLKAQVGVAICISQLHFHNDS